MGCGSSVQHGTAPEKYSNDSKKEDEAYKKIHSAVRWDKLLECKKIINSAEEANINDPVNGNRPIHIAAQNGHMEIVKFLIESGADLNVKNSKGNTAIHMAVGYDYYHIAKLLIEKGADPNLTNDGGFIAVRGLEGDKSMAFAQFVSALSAVEVMDALLECEKNYELLNKAAFVGSGLRLKKNLGSEWTEEIQSKFKAITQKL
jgi:ankyrin repeat protein